MRKSDVNLSIAMGALIVVFIAVASSAITGGWVSAFHTIAGVLAGAIFVYKTLSYLLFDDDDE